MLPYRDCALVSIDFASTQLKSVDETNESHKRATKCVLLGNIQSSRPGKEGEGRRGGDWGEGQGGFVMKGVC